MENSVLLDPAAMARLEEWGGSELVRQMIDIFLESGREKVDRIRESLAVDDLEGVERGAHSLKSSAGNLGAERLRALAIELEGRAERREPDGLSELFDRLDEVFEGTSAALQDVREETER